MELARLEPDYAAARVAEREHQPRREVVAPAHVREAGAAQLVEREAPLLRLRASPRPGESPSRNSRAISSPRPRLGEVLAHRRCRRRPPRAAARSTPSSARAPRTAARGAGARPRPAARPPRTRAGPGTARRATRSRRRSRGSRSRARIRRGLRPCRSRSSSRACRRVHGEARRPLLVERAPTHEPRA